MKNSQEIFLEYISLKDNLMDSDLSIELKEKTLNFIEDLMQTIAYLEYQLYDD